MSVAVFSEWLGNFGVERVKRLHAAGTIGDVYAYLGPDNAAAQANRKVWNTYRDALGGKLWAWIRCYGDQERTLDLILWLAARYPIDGWCLNLERESEGQKLGPFLQGVTALGKPIVASLAGTSGAHTNFDYRALDLAGVAVDWQCYFDSGEGPLPADAVRELYQCSFVVGGWEYRHWMRLPPANSATYGWGKVVGLTPTRADFNSYKRPQPVDATFVVKPRAFGAEVANRLLERDGKTVGWLLGRAQYAKIRVTLDVTRGYNAKRSPAEWEAIAASARVRGLRKRPVSVYMGEHSTDAVLEAMARGAA